MRARVTALVLALLALHGGDGEARRRATKGKRAAARTLNLPRSWTWPPSEEMLAEGQRCRERLAAAGVAFEVGPATAEVAAPVVVPTMALGGLRLASIWRRGPFVMDCHLAEAIALSASPALREIGVRDLRFSSIHDFRRVAGRRFLSRHAVGLAIDVYAFVTDDGEEHPVKRRYRRDPLLRRIEERLRASGFFRGPLTPGNDPRRHHDHFHVEARTAGERRPPASVPAPAAD